MHLVLPPINFDISRMLQVWGLFCLVLVHQTLAGPQFGGLRPVVGAIPSASSSAVSTARQGSTSGLPVCGEPGLLEASKPQSLRVQELVSGVRVTWGRPACDGGINTYVVVIDGSAGASRDAEVRCSEPQCEYELSRTECQRGNGDCLEPGVEHTFSVVAVLENAQLGPAVSLRQAVDVETCPDFVTPSHATTLCRGLSEVNATASCQNTILWKKSSMCRVQCQQGYGFFEQPAKQYDCIRGGEWSPSATAPDCYRIVPVQSANLQYRVSYPRESVANLKHQFDGLVYKYSDIFCASPERCELANVTLKQSQDKTGRPIVDVLLTVDPPVYNITNQQDFLEIVGEVLNTVSEDNAFMTLIDYDNVELLLPIKQRQSKKAEASFCCHTCPPGHAYRLGHCVQCPTPQCT